MQQLVGFYLSNRFEMPLDISFALSLRLCDFACAFIFWFRPAPRSGGSSELGYSLKTFRKAEVLRVVSPGKKGVAITIWSGRRMATRWIFSADLTQMTSAT